MTDQQKAAAYYKAGILKQAPPWVPATVRVLREQFGDFPFRGAGAAAGEHECHCNRWGAVSVTDREGKQLGLRLDEFDALTWRENEAPNVEFRGRAASSRSSPGTTGSASAGQDKGD